MPTSTKSKKIPIRKPPNFNAYWKQLQAQTTTAGDELVPWASYDEAGIVPPELYNTVAVNAHQVFVDLWDVRFHVAPYFPTSSSMAEGIPPYLMIKWLYVTCGNGDFLTRYGSTMVSLPEFQSFSTTEALATHILRKIASSMKGNQDDPHELTGWRRISRGIVGTGVNPAELAPYLLSVMGNYAAYAGLPHEEVMQRFAGVATNA